MNLFPDVKLARRRFLTRRWFFRQCGVGLGSIALGSLLQPESAFGAKSVPAANNPPAPKPPPFTPKPSAVFFFFRGGAPSQLDLFDYKPALAKYNGKPVPQDVVMGQ